ncbi:hypothetical protein SNEBB_001832 [Seison nebaliae]|nr:hypothetical protein SNEBB_001832 [Seison nebaliae]
MWEMNNNSYSNGGTMTAPMPIPTNNNNNNNNNTNELPPQTGTGTAPGVNGKGNTVMWMHDQWILDSGINSGYNTADPSLRSEKTGTSLNHRIGIANEEESATRVKAAMFGAEVKDESDMNESNEKNGQGKSNVEKLAKPASELNEAVNNMVNYHEEVNRAIDALPDLVRLSKDSDEVVRKKALRIVNDICKKDVCRRVIIRDSEMAEAIMKNVASNDLETVKLCLPSVNYMCGKEEFKSFIFKFNGIRALVALLSVNDDYIVNYALTSLHNILIYLSNSKDEMKRCSAVERLCTLLERKLKEKNYKFLAILFDTLNALCFEEPQYKLYFIKKNLLTPILDIVFDCAYEKLVICGMKLVRTLSVQKEVKQCLIDGQFPFRVTKIIRPEYVDARLLQHSLWALRNISDLANVVTNMDECIGELIEKLDRNDLNMRTCITGILSNLTCNNRMNKETVIKQGGVERLVHLLQIANLRQEILEPTVCCLRHLTFRTTSFATAIDIIRAENGIRPLMSIIENHTSLPLMKATIGLVRNLSQDASTRTIIRDYDGTEKLYDIALHSFNKIVEFGGPNHPDAPLFDGVRYEQVLEATLCALIYLCMDKHKKLALLDKNCVQFMIQIVQWPPTMRFAQRSAVGILCTLSKEERAAHEINDMGGTQLLRDLIGVPDTILATYAAGALRRIDSHVGTDLSQQQDNQQPIPPPPPQQQQQPQPVAMLNNGYEDHRSSDSNNGMMPPYQQQQQQQSIGSYDSGNSQIMNEQYKSNWHDTDL